MEKYKKEIVKDVEEGLSISTTRIEENLLIKYDVMNVLKEIHKLPEQMREVMYLRMASELSFKDIGEILEHSENWARVTYFRGKEKIMKGLMKNE